VKRRAWLGYLLACAFALSSLGASPSTGRGLFVIARSKNANVLHYDLRLNQDGDVDPDDPIEAYWIMRAENGRREGLTWLERQLAYGWSVTSKVRERGFTLELVALPGREVRVHRSESGQYRASTKISGQNALLERVFVKSEEGGALPRVVYVDLFGKHAKTGAPVSERLAP
jgi:hypothetical protein